MAIANRSTHNTRHRLSATSAAPAATHPAHPCSRTPDTPSSTAGIPRIAPAIPGAHEHRQRGHSPAGTTAKRDTPPQTPQTHKKPTSQRQSAAPPTRPRVSDAHSTGSSNGKSDTQARLKHARIQDSYPPIKHASTATTRASADTGPAEPGQLMPLMRHFPRLYQLMPSQASPSPRQPTLFFNVAYSCMFRV